MVATLPERRLRHPQTMGEGTMADTQADAAAAAARMEEMGPIDYVILEWPGEQPTGEVAPLIVDLVERGIIRVLDVAFLGKNENGSVFAIEIPDLDPVFAAFTGASSGLITGEDLVAAAEALEPGTSAAVLLWENRWAAPVAVALRRSGGQLVASGRIPVQAIIAALDATDPTD